MKIYPDTKIYVLCPANFYTGGPESLHQLASRLLAFGLDAQILYSIRVNKFFDENDPVAPVLKKYHVPYTFNFDDAPHNIFIVPESSSSHLFAAKKCRRVLWWMSVDNYFENIAELIRDIVADPLSEPIPRIFTFEASANDSSIEHWGQSEYVRRFLRLNGVKQIKTVETHMRQTFLRRAENVDFTAKKNFVAYNPRKGFEFTKKLIDIAPEIKWRPIENMTPAQVQELLAAAKIYIDFGSFPGRERLPREAAVSGCVVITGRRGAAGNNIDFNLPEEFKFDERTVKTNVVVKKIRDVLRNFQPAFDAQKDFREGIVNAQKKFSDEVAAVFEIKKIPRTTVALPQGIGAESYLLAEKFLRGNEFLPKFIVDDVMSTANAAEISNGVIVREQNRNYLRVDEAFVEIISRADARFLYHEERIKKFALLKPSDEEIFSLKDICDLNDIMVFDS